MKMKIFTCSLLLFLIYLTSVSCVSNSTFESMKMGISHFNKAGDDFFNLIRPPLNPNEINIENYKNFSFSLDHLNKCANNYLGYYVLLVIGVTLAVIIPLAGLVILCCRCCGKCGGKLKAMDPRRAKCKRIVYGLILVVLSFGMLFGSIIALFNNQIVHEAVYNDDKSVNIFLNFKSDFKNINQALTEVKESLVNSKPVKVEPQQLQRLSNDLDENIKRFYTKLVQIPEVSKLIEGAKTLKQALERGDINKSQGFIHDLNNRLGNLSLQLGLLKQTIKGHLNICSSLECESVKKKTDELQLLLVNQTITDMINKTMESLKNSDIQGGLTKIIDLKENNAVNMKLILEGELKYIKDKISNESFSESVKKVLISEIDRIMTIEQSIEENIPSPMQEQSAQQETYNYIKTGEMYRFYCYIGFCTVVLVIIVCYWLGLLFGTFGERPTEDSGCCNRGVGGRFLTSAIVLTFLIFSILMVIVMGNMLTTGVVHTEMCRYTSLENENDAKILDLYIKVIANMSNIKEVPHGIMDALLNKCSNQNFYLAFAQVNEKLILKSLQPFLNNIDEKAVSLVLSQINLTGLINTNPFASSSSVDLFQMINSISLLYDDSKFSQYLTELSSVTSFQQDVSNIRDLNNEILGLKSTLRIIIQFLNNTENEYLRLKIMGQIVENNKENIGKSLLFNNSQLQSPDLISSVQKSLFGVINGIFSEMFKDVSCTKLRSGVLGLFKTVCQNAINPLNGVWYGLGIFLLLAIPALIFACLLVGLYRRIQRFYPDKEEPDYENYIGFYARADNDAFKNNNDIKKPVHRGYKPIPLQPMS